ncbi:MAG: hypothetical protein K2Q18_17405 [Bdellovibrionales bacterium]|nr:hypothetical protein [Bdellovibrionales bacterium]
MILNYLLSLSILVMSVIKVTDLFLHIDHDLKAKRLEFIKDTKKTHEQGSITLIGILFTLMLSALLMFFALKFKIELKEDRYRKDSYLCFHYLNITTANYISDMTKLNWALSSAYAAQFTGVATVQAKAAFEALEIARDLRHIYHLKKLATNQYCKSTIETMPYLLNLPYKTKGQLKLETLPDGTTMIRKNQWSINFYKNPQGIRLKKSFCLKADMRMENDFFPNFTTKTSETTMEGFSKLKCLVGYR